MNETPDSLLATDEPPPFTVDNENGTSPLLIVADHAGKHFPRRLGQLGLSNAECERHIAWDIGVGAVCCLIGKALNAVVVQQNYSRLVIDCNRTPGSGTSILDLSELTRVPGNIGLSERHKLARVREIFQAYHDRIVTELDRRREAARPTALISMHSFTPVFKTVAAPSRSGRNAGRGYRARQHARRPLSRRGGHVSDRGGVRGRPPPPIRQTRRH
jgi:predicted N-formylglutamate amidohydrolase